MPCLCLAGSRAGDRVAGTPGRDRSVLLLLHRQHTCGEVHGVAVVPPTLLVLALQEHLVGGATGQGGQVQLSVHGQGGGQVGGKKGCLAIGHAALFHFDT